MALQLRATVWKSVATGVDVEAVLHQGLVQVFIAKCALRRKHRVCDSRAESFSRCSRANNARAHNLTCKTSSGYSGNKLCLLSVEACGDCPKLLFRQCSNKVETTIPATRTWNKPKGHASCTRTSIGPPYYSATPCPS